MGLQFELAHLKLPLVEDVDQILWNELRESSHECIKLLLNALVYTILNDCTVKPIAC